MSQKVPVIPAISADVPLNTRRVLLAMKTTIEYLLTQNGTVEARYTATPSSGAGSTSSGHNALSGLQGGTTNQFYHVTLSQHSALTGGSDTTLHYHTADRDLTNHTGILPWAQVDKTGAALTDFPTLPHNDLGLMQGGSTTERYHLLQAEHYALTGGGDTTQHYHADDRDRANHTGTQTASTISNQMGFSALLAFAAAHG